MQNWLSDLRFAIRFLRRNRGTTLVAVLALALGIGSTTAIFSVVYDVLLRPLPFPDSERIVAGVPGRSPRPAHEPDLGAELRGPGGPEPVPRGAGCLRFERPVGGRRFRARPRDRRVRLGLVLPSPRRSPGAGPLVRRGGGCGRRAHGHREPRLLAPVAGGRERPVPTEPALRWPGLRRYRRPAAGRPIPQGRRRLRSQGPPAPQPAPYRPQLADGGATPGRRFARAGPCRPAGDRAAAAQAARRRHRDGRRGGHSPARGPHGRRAARPARPARERRVPPARGLRQRGEPAARPGHRAPARAGGEDGRGRGAPAAAAPARDRGPRALPRRWKPRRRPGLLGRAEPGLARPRQAAASARGRAERRSPARRPGSLRGHRPRPRPRHRPARHRETALAALADGQRAPTGGPSRRLLDALVASQVAATMALLIGAGLLGRSLHRLLDVDPGFRTESVVAMDVSMPSEAGFPSRVRFQEEVIERLRGLPGVHAAGLVNTIPLGGGGADGTFLVVDHGVQHPVELEALLALFKDPERTGDANFRVASEGYFRALGIPLKQGRPFEASDGPDAPHVAVVSESFARGRWFGEGAVGRRIQFGNMDGDLRTFTIVGVVGDIREAGLDATPRPVLYASHRQRPRAAARVSFVIHADGDPGTLTAAARRIVRELDPEVPPRFRTIAELRAASVADRRLTLWLLAAFGASALTLAALGIYGVASYAVARRTREVGIRMALGAEPGQVLRMVLSESGRPVVVGAGLGLAAALALGRFMATLLYEVGPGDPQTIAGVALGLSAAALGAGFLPARRAARVDPAVALRSD